MGARSLADFDQVLAVLHELAGHRTVDDDDIAIRIVAADLTLALLQEAVIAHPVGEMMRQPRATLRAVIVSTRRTDFEREGFVPVNTFRAIRHVEAVFDAKARMLLLHLPCELVGAGIKNGP